MGMARYAITSMNGHWTVSHNGHFENTFDTKEAAFEAAVAAASLALKEGHDVHVSVISSSMVADSTKGS